MVKRKLVIVKNLREDLVEQVRNKLSNWDVIIGKDQEIWEPHLNDTEVIAGWNEYLEEKPLESLRKLRWIQSWSAGVDYLPHDELSKKHIYLTSANGVHAYPISETIFAHLLSYTRRLHAYNRNQMKKEWHHANLKLELHKKTIGIIGVGAIGKETAKIAKAFGMHVIGVRNSVKQEEYFDQIVSTNKLDSILPDCDYVVVTVPLTTKTHHMFGEQQFKNMKQSSFFVNIGRGEVVEETALRQALEREHIAGAGLDVFENEPLEETSPLWEMENVIITPHTAGATEYYDERVINDILLPNLDDYLLDQQPSINLVDYSKGY